MSLPRALHGLEGLAVGVAAVWIYFAMGESLMRFALLILAPDLGMLGYLAGPRVGSVAYNLLHTYVWPIALGLIGFLTDAPTIPFALIWACHIGFDRFLGFGLKYPTGFRETDLRRL